MNGASRFERDRAIRKRIAAVVESHRSEPGKVLRAYLRVTEDQLAREYGLTVERIKQIGKGLR